MSEAHLTLLPDFVTDENIECEETDNGLHLQNIYIPEEVLLHILSFVEPTKLLKYSLVCNKWNKLIKSHALWTIIYKRKYNRKPKQLPWYLYYCLLSTNYFDNNLIQNGNGQYRFDNWFIKANGGDKFTIEDPPIGSEPLPLDQLEFNGKTSCFVTSFGKCCKEQRINFDKNKLFRHILDYYKPHIYASEWMAGRFDCGCVYSLSVYLLGTNVVGKNIAAARQRVEQWEGRKWDKIEITITNYPEGVEGLAFEHIGRDTQFWAGHYGSKMAGGVLKFLWDSIEPLSVDDNGKVQPKTCSKLEYTANGLPETDQHFNNVPYDLWYDPQFLLDDEDEQEIYDDYEA